MATIARAILPDGLPGTARTIATMRDLAAGSWGARSPSIRALALNIVREAAVPEKDYLREAVALFQWVQRSIRYVRDPIGQELVTAPETLIQTRAGDCDDHAVMLAALLGSLGHRSRFVTIGFQADQPERFSHVYLKVQPAGSDTWIPLDAIKKDRPAGWEATAPVRRVWPANDQDHPMIASDLSDLGRFRLKKITKRITKTVSRVAAPVARPVARAAAPMVRPIARAAAPVVRPVARAMPAPFRRVAAAAVAPATGGASLLLARKRVAAPPRPTAPLVDPAAVALRNQAVASLRSIADEALARAAALDAQASAAVAQERDQATALLRALAEEAAAQASSLEAAAMQAEPIIDTTAEVIPAEEPTGDDPAWATATEEADNVDSGWN